MEKKCYISTQFHMCPTKYKISPSKFAIKSSRLLSIFQTMNGEHREIKITNGEKSVKNMTFSGAIQCLKLIEGGKEEGL